MVFGSAVFTFVRSGKERATLIRVVLDDHARLPGRFFGRLTAAVQAPLTA